MKNYLKRTTTFFLALLMLVSVPLQAFAEIGERKINYDENPISDSGFKEGYINNKDIDVKVAKPKEGSQNFIDGPDIPDIYTMKVEYKIQRGDRQINNYQPYEASVGADIKDEDKKKIKQTINLPNFDGYTAPTPTPEYDVTHEGIVKKAKEANHKDVVKKEGPKTWTEHKGVWPYVYTGAKNTLKVKHIFQTLEDRSIYSKVKTASGEYVDSNDVVWTEETGSTGSIVTISPLEKEKIKGFEPERNVIETQMPEHTDGYVVEYRYNRKHFNVSYDTKDGSPIATRTIYYGQRIPTIPLVDEKGDITKDQNADPTYKLGSTFKGWKPSINLTAKDGTIYEKDKTIKDKSGNPSKTLDLDLIMPAENITFTAEWKDKEKADYAVQYWAEKADHAEGASLLEKYDYMGAKVYRDEDTGKRPDLDNQPIDGIVFPDLDKARLQKIWNGDKFNRDQLLYLNKFYVYNKSLTADQNKDPKDARLVKSVSSTGKTVYNIYFDRQVYELYFTQSNYLAKTEPQKTFYPEVYKFDEKQEKAVKVGWSGNPYHFKARFNQLMLDWPNDGMQIKGFTSGNNSHGWSPNMQESWWSYRDTPPYRLSADQFLDFPEYDSKGGYTKKIDNGDGTNIDLDPLDFKTLSFGIEQYHDAIPHHMDFWMDGFKPGETIIRYDLYRSKADTKGSDYGHKYTVVKGFTPYGFTGTDFKQYPTVRTTMYDENGIEDLNGERDEITPIPDKEYKDIFGFKHKVGQLNFILAFFDNADSYGDAKDGKPFKKNGYLRYKYTRNKYPLRFNYDPSKIKADNEFDSTNSLETYYNFPLKVLSPDLFPALTKEDIKAGKKQEYFKENPANFLDNPENLKTLGLTDLVYNDPKDGGKLKVKRPDNLPDQMEFKGWALDPAGTKLVWENKDEKMPAHAVNLYAKWGEPDYKWKVTVDPNGGSLYSIKRDELTKETKTIQEGDIGNEKTKTYPEKLPNEDKKQVFTVIQRQQLNEPKNHPRRPGYDFLGWEWVRFDENGNEDKSYYNEYKVPELYSFGNDLVSDVYLRAIWVKNDLQTVMAYHHILDKDLNEIEGSPEPQELPKRRIGYTAAALGSKQGAEYTLVPEAQWEDLKQKNYTFAKYYDKETGRTNNYFQVHRIEGPNGKQPDDFHFFYMPYRKREYKVNYLDERCRADVEKFIKTAQDSFNKNYEAIKNSNRTEDQKREAYRNLLKTNEDYLESIVSKYSIIDAETVINGKRHYDARNYRHIPGWTLADNESPQQQLFFDVDENTNEFLGINKTGLGQIFFFYQDARAIEVKDPDEKVPEGYVRVTFKAEKGGSFGKDDKGDDIKALYYDVIKGLKWDSLPVPQEWDGLESQKDKDKNYITPDSGKKFEKWDNKPLLNKGTILQSAPNDYYVFTAYFDWSGLTSSGLVRTEAYKDPNGKWTNDFAPTLKDLKKQLVWKEREQVKPIPEGTEIKLVYKDKDGKETELKTDKDVFNLVKEMNIDDATETVRVVNIVAKVTFKDGKQAQVLPIPITVYKNRYEALNEKGDKPEYLTKAENTEAKDGGLKDILKDNTENRYIKVTVKPNRDFDNKDDKVYYVNPNAWVDIPKIDTKGDSNFTNWTADKDAQNEEGKKDGIFDFGKRHKFTEDTVITPVGAKDVVEQTDPNKKPDVPDSYVKVIVKTTDKAIDETAFEKTFWVNPTRDVAITVANPDGKTDQEVDLPKLGKKKVNYVFNEWRKVKAGEAEDNLTDVKPAAKIDLAKNKFTDKVTVIEASYFERFAATPIVKPIKTKELRTPEGKEITNDDLIKQITPQEGKEIESIEVISKPDGNTVGNEPAKVIVKYKDGSTQGTNDNPVIIPVEVHKNIIPEAPGGQKPKEALENYVKVIFTAGEGGKLDKTLTGNFVYYVSPEVEVDLNATANDIGKIPATGYIANGGKWENKDKKELKGTFKDKETVFKYNFFKSKDIVEKTDQNPDKPEGYVTVKFIAGENGEVVGGNKTYFVNPDANIKLVDKDKATQGATNELVVPEAKASDNYGFTGWVEKIDYTNPIKGDREHVAKFTLGKVTLTYEAGEGAKGTAPTAVTVDHGTIIRLANADGLSKDNATFAGWKLDGDDTIYQPGAQVKLEKARTATAQWTTSKHTVKFILTDGAQFAQEEVEHGKTATKPNSTPTKDGFVFAGWKEKGKENETTFFDFATEITADKILVAQWTDAVQKIGENDTVEEQFIKVTFNEGKHGKLKLDDAEQTKPVTYKVAKDYDFDKAVQAGLKVPGINPTNYYKVKTDNKGWDQALALSGKDITFTAQYELVDNVIPVDKNKDNETLMKEKPDDMVLVTFEVNNDKAYMMGDTKFYVKRSEVVNITPPLVLAKDPLYVFKGWGNFKTTEGKIAAQFDVELTEIKDSEVQEPKLTITMPRIGRRLVYIEELVGETGKLKLTSGTESKEYSNIVQNIRGEDFDVFKLDAPLKRGDIIEYWAENSGRKSLPIRITME